jgi:hypothetical protein
MSTRIDHAHPQWCGVSTRQVQPGWLAVVHQLQRGSLRRLAWSDERHMLWRMPGGLRVLARLDVVDASR